MFTPAVPLLLFALIYPSKGLATALTCIVGIGDATTQSGVYVSVDVCLYHRCVASPTLSPHLFSLASCWKNSSPMHCNCSSRERRCRLWSWTLSALHEASFSWDGDSGTYKQLHLLFDCFHPNCVVWFCPLYYQKV